MVESLIARRKIADVWAHHGAALAAKDVDAFVVDFADDCLFINNPRGGHASGVYRGPQGVREWCKSFFRLFEQIGDFVTAPPAIVDNVAVVEWEIHGKASTVVNGIDTFVVKDGQFHIITVVYEVQSPSAG